MNPLTNMRKLNEMNARELEMGTAGVSGKSWHEKYKDSAWVYIGGLAYELTEGDIICVFSQYGEVVNINLVRDRKTGKSKGFCFLCYEDQRSTVLAVDNFNGIKVAGRLIRVDHVEEYKVPKDKKDETQAEVKAIWEEGCAPKPLNLDEIMGGKEKKKKLDKAERKEQKRAKKEQKKEKKRKRRAEEMRLLPLDEQDMPELARKRLRRARKREARAAGKTVSSDSESEGEPADVKPSTAAAGGPLPSNYYSDNFITREGKDRDPDRTMKQWTKVDPSELAEGGKKQVTDEGEEIPEHRVTMSYFDSVLIKDRYMKPDPTKQTTTDWREQEIMKMERDREKRLQGEDKPKQKDSYIPHRFK